MAEPARPAEREEGAPPAAVVCPFCRGRDTELVSPFGGQLSVAQYWCRRCRTGFDYIKWEDEDGDRG
ncbi:MAG TPA: hypothetical protein VFX98_03925 [Longimicrobiaceae bacterium]|nr:hypothetical protein [Longimicrobiaceae bacterium]